MSNLYLHDCDKCEFLGVYEGHDLYFHPGELPTVIARYSSDGPDYHSGIEIARTGLNRPLAEALRLAEMCGML